MIDLLNDKDFIELEKQYKFLSRARNVIEAKHGELEKLSYVIFDFETTGLDAARDEIIEAGALKVENSEIKGVFNKLVKPEKPLPSNITELTGITPEMLENEPSVKLVIRQFMDFAGDSILVAHNADFDVSFLTVNAKKWLNRDIQNLIVCTLLVARDILPNLENHKLQTIARYYQFNVVNRHRAIGDVELTYQIWLKLIEKLKERNILTRKDLESYLSVLNGGSNEKAPF